MKKWLLTLFGIVLNASSIYGSNYTIKGKVTSQADHKPLEFASIYFPQSRLWGVTDTLGNFAIVGVPKGEQEIIISCLGYVKSEFKVMVDRDITNLQFALPSDNIGLEGIVVTARNNKYNPATSYIIDKTTLEHHQVSALTDISTLLPGGKTAYNNNLASSSGRRFEIRSSAGELGNPTFMTAVEIDGIRLGNNASFNETQGIDVRNIATSNIESIEVIVGTPSVEYGDVSGGIVKVNTQKGETPFQVQLSMGPKTKIYSLTKGVNLGYKNGILNMSLERAISVSDMASPYTTYDRNGITLYYNNIAGRSSTTPLKYNATLAGNFGGYNTASDPDSFRDTYTKQRQNTLRGALGFEWLIRKPYLTGMEGSASVNYSNRRRSVRINKSSSTSTAVFHGTEEGYFIATDYDTDPNAAISLIPSGYWYENQHEDDRPIEYNASLKLYHQFYLGHLYNKLKLGAQITSIGNLGRGYYYDDPRYTPTWRPYDYSQVPFMTNTAFYLENMATLPIGNTFMQLTAGVRQDITQVDGSRYGRVSALSPRFSINYTLINNPSSRFSSLKLRAGVGNAVKLPSFAVLYHEPNYNQQLTFAPGALTDGTTHYAYYIIPSTSLVNTNLKWQNSQQVEMGIDLTWRQINFSLNIYQNKTRNGYSSATHYTPFNYKFTDQKSIEGTGVPVEHREFRINRQSGIVTLYDRTGQFPSQTLNYTERTTYVSNTYATNISPVTRQGLEWVLDFGRVRSIYTSFRLDGSYYHYKGVNETLIASLPTSSQLMADGSPYKYVGYYAGSSSVSNGSETHRVNSNLTITSNIPKIKLLVSLRIESTLYHATRNLSEYNGNTRGVVLERRTDYTGTSSHIYGGDNYVAIYPQYYSSYDSPNQLVPFEEMFLWAQTNDVALFNELTKLVSKSNTSYYFNTNRISPYYSANLTITKDLGKHFSLSFYANNFFNNLNKVRTSWNNSESTLLGSSRIASFNYGVTLRVKL